MTARSQTCCSPSQDVKRRALVLLPCCLKIEYPHQGVGNIYDFFMKSLEPVTPIHSMAFGRNYLEFGHAAKLLDYDSLIALNKTFYNIYNITLKCK